MAAIHAGCVVLGVMVTHTAVASAGNKEGLPPLCQAVSWTLLGEILQLTANDRKLLQDY